MAQARSRAPRSSTPRSSSPTSPSARQPQLTALAAPEGTINSEGNPLEWTRLKGVPGGLADGVDDISRLRLYCALVQANPRSFPDAPCRAHKELVDAVGTRTSIGIGTDGNPVVSYKGPGGTLKVAHCSDPACAGRTLNTLDTNGFDTSIVIGTDGRPVVSYLDGSNSDRKVARPAIGS